LSRTICGHHEDTLARHAAEVLVADLAAVLDGVDAGLHRQPDGAIVPCVGGDLYAARVRFVHDGLDLVETEKTIAVVSHDLDHVGASPEVLAHGASCLVRPADGEVFSVDDGDGRCGHPFDRLPARRGDLARRRADARSRDPAGFDSVAK